MTVSSTEGEVETQVETDTQTHEQDVNSAESSTTENEGAASLSDVISTALKDSDEEAAPASEEQGSEEPDSTSTEDDDELSDEEKRHLSERTQNRFRDLVDKRKAAEVQADEFRKELDTLKPKAEHMDRLTGYMQQHAISPDHLDNALGLTAMINGGDYERALPILESLLSQVKSAAGDVLPADLQKRVDLGYITEADAKALHKAQLRNQRSEQKTEQDRQRQETERQQNETRAVVDQAVRTADAWTQEQANSDPDWNLKNDRVSEKLELEINRRVRQNGIEGWPKTEKEVRDILQKCKSDVEAELRKFRAPLKAINTPSGGSPSPRSQAKPESVMDAVNQALGG